MANATTLEKHDASPPIANPADFLTPGAEKIETTLELVELLLKDQARLDRVTRQPLRQGDVVPRFLLIALTGYLIYSCIMVLVINLAPSACYPTSDLLSLPAARWSDGSALALPVAYTASIVLASCVCLPSFYFYSLLAGVRITWLQIVGLITKATAYNAIILLGLLPIYVALVMGLIVFGAPPSWLQFAVLLGLSLPFVAGFAGVRVIYRGVADLATAMPEAWRCRRACFLRRLTVSWSAVYTAVLPVMIYRLWEWTARLTSL